MNMRGKYIAFGSDNVNGGMWDLLGYGEDLEYLFGLFECSNGEWLFNNTRKLKWWHIIDTDRMKIIGGSEERWGLVNAINKMEYRSND